MQRGSCRYATLTAQGGLQRERRWCDTEAGVDMRQTTLHVVQHKVILASRHRLSILPCDAVSCQTRREALPCLMCLQTPLRVDVHLTSSRASASLHPTFPIELYPHGSRPHWGDAFCKVSRCAKKGTYEARVHPAPWRQRRSTDCRCLVLSHFEDRQFAESTMECTPPSTCT